MRYIKLFENFKHRKPKMITAQEYQQKFFTRGVEDFTTEQRDFLQGLIDNNKGWIYDYELKNNFVQFRIYPIGDDDSLIEIQITKLKDNWYLILEPDSDRFECDEWDEVLGYLGSQTLLKF